MRSIPTSFPRHLLSPAKFFPLCLPFCLLLIFLVLTFKRMRPPEQASECNFASHYSTFELFSWCFSRCCQKTNVNRQTVFRYTIHFICGFWLVCTVMNWNDDKKTLWISHNFINIHKQISNGKFAVFFSQQNFLVIECILWNVLKWTFNFGRQR